MFISAITLSYLEDDAIINTSEVGSLDAFASSLPLSSRVISHSAYEQVTGGHVHGSKSRGPDLCAKGFISQWLLWECVSSGTNCLKKGRMDSLYG